MSRARRNVLTLSVAVLGVVTFALYTWAEYGYFCDQARSHHEACTSFWALEHIHDFVYNAMANFSSEVIFGILLVVLLHRLEGRKDASP